jgi:hypothetical protein
MNLLNNLWRRQSMKMTPREKRMYDALARLAG